jgi:superfamily II DNA or RNA helicase
MPQSERLCLAYEARAALAEATTAGELRSVWRTFGPALGHRVLGRLLLGQSPEQATHSTGLVATQPEGADAGRPSEPSAHSAAPSPTPAPQPKVKTRTYSPGALVSARGRDWIVLPPEEPGVVRLRPVDGLDHDVIGVFLQLEEDSLAPSSYAPPDPSGPGDFTGALLLRDAVRLSLRSGAGPFRSVGRLEVTPRPYQFVPLIMALRLAPVRMLIADDVGVGKTIEAAMIARELLDRGVAARLAVICAPHLCDQWEKELRNKFDLEAAVIQPSRMARLERNLPRPDIGVFQYYRHLVASIDFIKSSKYRRSFIDFAPDLVIVDEAHTASRPRGDHGTVQHQRYSFLRDLAASPERHLILVTATPHSGIEESFRSLLGLLEPSFDIPEDSDLPRAKLVPHMVQRRRSDLEHWMGSDTPFPERDATERKYELSPEYLKLFEDVLSYCRESVSASEGALGQRQRVRYWAATAILRCVLSSPAAAEAMLEKRRDAKRDGSIPSEEFEGQEALARQILDSAEEEEPSDYVPTAPLDDPKAQLTDAELRRLDGFLKRAQTLRGEKHDAKLAEAMRAVDELLSEGYRPIVYCRFIATAKYVAEELQSSLEKKHPGLRAVSVTGNDGDSEQRAEIVAGLAAEPVRVLVATECLSEGINLQDHFDAVVHYDLPWNPNRLEQREGRVDRYGQERAVVKTVLLYGSNNPIDLVVLEVLIRKAQTIRKKLGISVPVPVESEQVIQAIVDSVLLRRRERGMQLELGLTDPKVSSFHEEWDKAADREGKARAYFAQEGIKPDEVARELEEMEPALGGTKDVEGFVANALQRFNGELRQTKRSGVWELYPGDVQPQMALRDPRAKFPMRVAFDGVAREGVTLIERNHSVVAVLTQAVLARALSGTDDAISRCSAIYTEAVRARTAVILLRLRYLLEEAAQQFAEEVLVAAFRRAGEGIEWLRPFQPEALKLLSEARPAATNVSPTEKQQQVAWALSMLEGDWSHEIVEERKRALEESHARLRKMVKAHPLTVTPHTPPDILGCYVLVPTGGGR